MLFALEPDTCRRLWERHYPPMSDSPLVEAAREIFGPEPSDRFADQHIANRTDRYGIRNGATIRELAAAWPGLCRSLFVERYAAWPAAAKTPLDALWQGIWQGNVTGPCVVMVRAPVTERYGMIEIPKTAQADRACGFIAAVSPMLWFPAVIDSCAYRPMFDHPLDLIGKCYLFQPYSGISIKGRVTDSAGTDTQVLKIRIEDLHMEMNELDLRDGSERVPAPVTEP